jgi:hypothetical protein
MAHLLGQFGQPPADALFVVDDEEVGHVKASVGILPLYFASRAAATIPKMPACQLTAIVRQYQEKDE